MATDVIVLWLQKYRDMQGMNVNTLLRKYVLPQRIDIKLDNIFVQMEEFAILSYGEHSNTPAVTAIQISKVPIVNT